MLKEAVQHKGVQIFLYFLALGLLAAVLKYSPPLLVGVLGPPVLVLGAVIVYKTSDKVKQSVNQSVNQYMERKGKVRGILLPFIMLLQVLCLLAFMYFDPSAWDYHKLGVDHNLVLRKEFLSRTALFTVFFLIGIRSLITSFLEGSKVWQIVEWVFLLGCVVFYIWFASQYPLEKMFN